MMPPQIENEDKVLRLLEKGCGHARQLGGICGTCTEQVHHFVRKLLGYQRKERT